MKAEVRITFKKEESLPIVKEVDYTTSQEVIFNVARFLHDELGIVGGVFGYSIRFRHNDEWITGREFDEIHAVNQN